jgi:hypothetical protein
MRAVTAEQKRQILQLVGDFPRLWAASTTVPRDRKRSVRLLVRDITVTKGPEPRAVRLHIRWQGGATETSWSRYRRSGRTQLAIPRRSSSGFENWRSTTMTTKSQHYYAVKDARAQ